MKTRKLSLFLAGTMLLHSWLANANDEKYIQAMQKNIRAVYEATSIDGLQIAVNGFERIGSVETNRWEPQYYAAFGYLMMSTREQDPEKKDVFIDLAMASVNKAKDIASNESEIIALEGFALMMRVSVDPGSRGPLLAGLSVQSFEKALKLDPGNPRALVLLARMQFGTAQFFGSQTTEACETLDRAIEKFEASRSDNVLAPQWGKQMALGLKEKCK